jgi:DNA-binding NarL/FixJ family response regulator
VSIQIVLADDHRMVREGLHALLEKQNDMKVIAEAGDGRTAVKMARKLRPNVVVMDLTMPDLNGIEATREVLRAAPGVKVIVLSMHSDKRFVAEALRAGAAGYVLKGSAFEELANAVRIVASNQSYLSPAISGAVIQDYLKRAPKPASSAFVTLTRREREVLQLLAEGKTTKQNATALCISAKTVETHRKHIMDKLGTHSIAELTKYAIREGLTAP